MKISSNAQKENAFKKARKIIVVYFHRVFHRLNGNQQAGNSSFFAIPYMPKKIKPLFPPFI
ncbi:hypothetical protein, partial [Bacillus sp. S20C3]|uniref:hypothetical protein n=1 Tax=Bacillus sp. S20C3 TaxID=2918910 RepID=UPI00228182DC|nr:hypothetical protein [Bacillus sp. S20C3]